MQATMLVFRLPVKPLRSQVLNVNWALFSTQADIWLYHFLVLSLASLSSQMTMAVLPI